MTRLSLLLIACWATLLAVALPSGTAGIGWTFLADLGGQAPVLILLLYICLHLLLKAIKNWMRYREYSELR